MNDNDINSNKNNDSSKKKNGSGDGGPTTLNVEETIRPMKEIFDSLDNLSYEWRMEQLRTFRRMLTNHKEEYIDALFQDLGKERVEAIASEYLLIEAEVDYCMANLSTWMEEQHVPSPLLFAPAFSKLKPKPLRSPGILIIGPFNYPLMLTLQVAVGTLAAGNPTLIKPSELTPNVSAVIHKYVKQYFKHNKALQVVEGDARVTKALIQQPWGMIVFTGSERVGKLVAIEAAKTLTPCILELGGKSPCYVDYETSQSLALDVMANRIVWGKTFNTGQTCVGIDYLIIHEKHVDTLCPELVASIQRQFGNDPKHSELGRICTSSKAHAQRAIDLIQQVEQEFENNNKNNNEEEEKTSEKKGKIIYGGSKTCNASVGYICPTIILNPPKSCRLLTEEIFAPILPILVVNSRDEAIELIRSITRTQEAGGSSAAVPLALYVFTDSNQVFEYVTDRCPSAMATRNDCVLQFGSVFLPVGGMGGSCGYGRYHGKFSFDTFSHYLPVLTRPCFTGSDTNMMRFHPFTEKILSVEKRTLITKLLPKLPGSVPVLFRRKSKSGNDASSTPPMVGYVFKLLYFIILLLIISILYSLHLELSKLRFESVPFSSSSDYDNNKIKITSENLGFTVEL